MRKTRARNPVRQPLTRRDLFSTPSGLGGSFTVYVMDSSDLPDDRVRVRVHMPSGGDDWHGYVMTPRRADLRPLNATALVEG